MTAGCQAGILEGQSPAEDSAIGASTRLFHLDPITEKTVLAGASSGGEETSDFVTRVIDGGKLWLHVHPSQRYKSTTIDLFLPTPLRAPHATGLSLLSRLLERGTQKYPSIRELNQYTDWLYGAGFFATTQRLGAWQALRLHFGAVDDRFLPQPEGLLAQGCQLLTDALWQPHTPSGTFDPGWVQQERQALGQSLASADADRTALAQRRCLQVMCPDEPYRLSAEGEAEDLDRFDNDQLIDVLRDHTRHTVGHVFICGDIEVEEAVNLCSSFAWDREPEPAVPLQAAPTAAGRQLVEHGDASQGRLLIGYRGGATLADAQYPAFLVLNLILGGENFGRLYRRIREEAGLCYHIGSYIEPAAGFLFVEAGIDAGQLERITQQISSELAGLSEQGPSPDEVDNAKRLILQRLQGIADHRDALVHFHLQRHLAGAAVGRSVLSKAISGVDAEQVRAMARCLARDTTYLLAPAVSTVAAT